MTTSNMEEDCQSDTLMTTSTTNIDNQNEQHTNRQRHHFNALKRSTTHQTATSTFTTSTSSGSTTSAIPAAPMTATSTRTSTMDGVSVANATTSVQTVPVQIRNRMNTMTRVVSLTQATAKKITEDLEEKALHPNFAYCCNARGGKLKTNIEKGAARIAETFLRD